MKVSESNIVWGSFAVVALAVTLAWLHFGNEVVAPRQLHPGMNVLMHFATDVSEYHYRFVHNTGEIALYVATADLNCTIGLTPIGKVKGDGRFDAVNKDVHQDICAKVPDGDAPQAYELER